MIPLSYNFRSLMVRKRTTGATALGVGLVVYVLAASLMLSDGIKKTLSDAGNPSHAIVLRKGSQAELESVIEEDRVSMVLAAPGVKQDPATTRAIGGGEIIVVAAMDKLGTNGGVSNVSIRGVRDDVLKMRPEVKIIEGRPAKPGADEVIAGARIRGRFAGVDLGQKFDIKKDRPVSVVGVFEANGSAYESEVWADIDVVRTAFKREGMVSSIRVALESPTKFEAFEAAVESDKQLGLEAQRETAYYERQSYETAVFITALGVIMTVFFSMGAMIGAAITMYAAVAGRQREIGTLRALGFPRRSILVSFLMESIMLTAAGGVLGVIAALGMGFVKFSIMNFVSWSEVVFSFHPTPEILLTSVIAAGVMGLLGGFLPAVRASAISPLKAIRE